MSSIDDLFRKPYAPSASANGNGNGKRKIEAPDHKPTYKSVKLTAGNDVETEDDLEAGPALPPSDQDDNADEADQEGRFFGGGINRDTTDALDYLDTAEEDTAANDEVIDAPWVRRMVFALERKIAQNARQRAKFESEPAKFIDSEAELDADIKIISLLTEHADLYGTFVAARGTNHLVSLLSHENTDIAINAIEIIAELLADDVQVDQDQWDLLANSMLEADLLGLLLQNLARFDELQDESDRLGVYHVFAVLEALASQPTIADKVGDERVLGFLLSRIQVQETTMSQNKQYAAEVFQVLLQASQQVQSTILNSPTLNAVDVLLQTLAVYRKRDPEKDSNDREFAEDVFDALICLVSRPEGRLHLKQAEGMELMLIMLREGGRFSRQRALKVLDHAMSGDDSHGLCVRFVEAAGLKPLFVLFAKSEATAMTNKSGAPVRNAETAAMTEHFLGIFASLLRSLPGESEVRIRALAKFVEKDYDKVAMLVNTRRQSRARLAVVDKQIQADEQQQDARADTEDEAERAAERLSRRLDAGLYSAQTVDLVLAWLAAEDPGARTRIQQLLDSTQESLATIRHSIDEQLQAVDDDSDPTAVEILRALTESLI